MKRWHCLNFEVKLMFRYISGGADHIQKLCLLYTLPQSDTVPRNWCRLSPALHHFCTRYWCSSIYPTSISGSWRARPRGEVKSISSFSVVWLSDQDQEKLPSSLQFLPPMKKREPDSVLWSTHVKTLLLLATTWWGCDYLHGHGVYEIIRDAHLEESVEKVHKLGSHFINVDLQYLVGFGTYRTVSAAHQRGRRPWDQGRRYTASEGRRERRKWWWRP